ncbi:5-methyltetrahydropteroyltriglutamate--homocysteine S-methyltransferase [Haematomicrobium sanguinis]|uniref:5-methyltetrahydropteroyltriglutamate-- homocysteine S-methyltransferase n=1 Tax=Haematomicrobium sanguinis TaxID=479106 RepID=UPI0012FB801D|nr:5-methyltetrahydropteroyltriglutamate--homocysteine S-methyltransferase [Haematomicrobium sanguinis]
MTTQFPSATIVGYPRIGRRRELKKAVESYWAGHTSLADLTETARELRLATYQHLADLGLDPANAAIPATFSYYDQVLDTATHVGAVPHRFTEVYDGDEVTLAGYFTLARGDSAQAPLEMTKWFDSNYHYLVPELSATTAFRVTSNAIVDDFVEAKNAGFITRPSLIGPVTFLLLSKAAEDAGEDYTPLDSLKDILPAYRELLARLHAAGAPWIQLDESALVADHDLDPAKLAAAIDEAYTALTAATDRPQIFVNTAYGSLKENLTPLAATGIDAIHLDLFKGDLPSAKELELLRGKVVVAGVVDGHNIWANNLDRSIKTLESIKPNVDALSVSTSTSLLHVPYTLEDEQALDPELRSWLAFADEKVAEVVQLARFLDEPESITEALTANRAARSSRETHPGVRVEAIRQRTGALDSGAFTRAAFADRASAQSESLKLPELPTTTIGSFPQTAQVRSARARLNKGALTQDEYTALMQDEIKRVIDLQEELGFDVLVHGEPERNDMVQYFAENLDGFDVTSNGWVQSYGSRCTRPSILWGDVSRPAPITVPWSTYAQSLTEKPVKGMLTGPVTILAWSFARDDQSLGDTANQVALALRDEIDDLQTAGIGIIQVDEPALRELLPLRKEDQAGYLDWSVNAFRLATAGAHSQTQIHTHLCYSEFGEVIDAIDGLDADVTSIEAARSKMEVVNDLDRHGFSRGVGPGVYDIHSPRVPSEEEVSELLERAVAKVPAAQLWVNPDCGLKTRGYAETEASLRNLVAATRRARANLNQLVSP